MAVRDYDPGAMTLTWGSILITGFAEGTFITWESDGPAFTKVPGAQGEVTRVRMRSRTSRITFRLMQTAPANDTLSLALSNDQRGLSQKAPVTLKDELGTTTIVAEQGWIEGWPSTAFASGGDEAREWVLDLGETQVTLGGSVT